jgi:hypothetical protein
MNFTTCLCSYLPTASDNGRFKRTLAKPLGCRPSGLNTMENAVIRKCVWMLTFLLLAVTWGCSDLGNEAAGRAGGQGQVAYASAPEPQSQLEEDQHQPANIEEPTQTTRSDQQMEPEISDQGIGPETDEGLQLATTGEQSGTTSVFDQQVEPPTETRLQPADFVERSQSPSGSDQSTNPKTDNEELSAGSPDQSQTTSMSDQEIETQAKAGNPTWMTEPAPREFESRESFLLAGLNLSESAEFIPADSTSNSLQAFSATRIFGTLNLVKAMRRFTTDIDYKGGGFFYRDSGSPWSKYEVQQLTAREDISWKRTKLTLEDSLTDFPGASFGSGAFGGAGAYNLGLGGSSSTSNFFGFNDFGGLGRAQHITNIALGSIRQDLTPRSGVAFAGAYALTHYFDNASVNSQQASVLAGYNYQFTPQSNIWMFYGYQGWKFTGGDSTTANIAQVTYGHQFSPRMTASLGAGPQFLTSRTPTEIQLGPVQIPIVLTSRQTGFNADASLGYTLRRGVVSLYYEHLLTSGSGLFAGATSDISTFNMSRPILRAWATDFTAGFVRLSSLGNRSSGILGSAFQYWFASVGVQRRLGQHFSVLGSYQFNDQTNISSCSAFSGCGNIVHTALISISWHTNPIHLDRGMPRGEESSTIDNPPVDIRNPVAMSHLR